MSAPEIAEAIERAHQELKLVGWKSTSEAEAKEVSSETFEQGSKGLEYFEQCQNDVVVLVLHTYRDEH
ncbi:MAG: hypothetical protein KF683_09625 [Rubrivivax sp.]|nr:hypothetical protein [Rubrivivax sp.]